MSDTSARASRLALALGSLARNGLIGARAAGALAAGVFPAAGVMDRAAGGVGAEGIAGRIVGRGGPLIAPPTGGAIVGRGANGADGPAAPGVGGADVDGRANGAGMDPGCTGRGGAAGAAATGVMGRGGTGDIGRGADAGAAGVGATAAGGGAGVGRTAGAGIANAGVARAGGGGTATRGVPRAGVARGGVIGDGTTLGGAGVGRAGGACAGIEVAGVGIGGTGPDILPDGPDVRGGVTSAALATGAAAMAGAKSVRWSAPADTVITPPQIEQRARIAVPGNFAGSTRKTERHSGQVTFIRGLRRALRSSVR